MTANNFKDYYQILGVNKNASTNEIKAAYYKLARKYHPDLNPGDKSKEDCLKEINEAQEILSDPQKRQEFDRYIEYEQQKPENSSSKKNQGFGIDLKDFKFSKKKGFSNFIDNVLDRFGVIQENQTFFYNGIEDSFGGLNGPQPDDITGEISLTLSQAFYGVEQQLPINDETINICIPPGAKTGSCLRIKEKGKLSPLLKKRGNFYLYINLQPHPLFKFEGDNLTIEIPITPAEAVLGREIVVPTPNGKATLIIPPLVNSGQSLKLKEKGWYQSNRQRSDLIIKLKIVTPENLSSTEQEHYQQILQASNFNPRQNLEYIRL